MARPHKGHACEFCERHFRKADHRRQHENSVHPAAIRERDLRFKRRQSMVPRVESANDLEWLLGMRIVP